MTFTKDDGVNTYTGTLSGEAANLEFAGSWHIQLKDGGDKYLNTEDRISIIGGTGAVIDTNNGDDLINVSGVESFSVSNFGGGDSIKGVDTNLETVDGGIKAGNVTIYGLSKGDRRNEWQIADNVGKYVPVSVAGAVVDNGTIIYQNSAEGAALVELDGLSGTPEVSGTTIELEAANFAGDISVTKNTNGYIYQTYQRKRQNVQRLGE